MGVFVRDLRGRAVSAVNGAEITITEATSAKGENFSFSLLEDRLIIAQKSELIENAIDAFKGQGSYADKPGVKKTLAQPLSLKNSLVNVYIPSYGEMLKQYLLNQDQELPVATLKQLDAIGSVVMGIAAQEQGLHLQAIAQFNPDSFKSLPSEVSGDILSTFPETTLMVMNGKNLAQGWSVLVEESAQDPELEDLVRQIRRGFSQANFDVDREVFGWLDGEFAMGMVTLERGGIANLGLAGIMMLETSDRQTGEEALTKLNQLAQSNPNIISNERNIDNIQVTEWTAGQQGIILSYGWLDNQKLRLNLGTSWETSDQQKAQQSLTKQPIFQTIESLLPKDNLGYFYLDFQQLTQQLKTFPGTLVDPDTEAVLNSIQGLGMTATLPNKSTSQLDLVLSIQSTDQ
ncbi:MAG: DUF3352 domain-containing protein [Cyanobacteria bacterium P01_G01_bin.49]